jgi:hypothetical protein
MVAASKIATVPKLTAKQEASVFDAVAALRSARALRGGEKRRFALGLKRPRVRERFVANAYAEYLHQGGAAGDMAEFVKWLLQWVVDNQETILKLIMALVSIFA